MNFTNQTLKTVLLAFISGIAGTLVLYYFLPTKDRVLVQYEQATPNRYANLLLEAPQKLDFVEASEASTPAVVFIKTASTVYNQMSWFDYYFNGSGGTQQQV
ncbi:MAG: hypothetical protein H7329_20150, partial [Opitutaceae bacterium]|nr:hypothetical protein [Cytophagales bacterium]